MQLGQVIPPTPQIIVIFGITGDLAQRYLIPALYHLIKDGLLDPRAEIIGITRQDITTEQLLERVDVCVHDQDEVCDQTVLDNLRARLHLIQMDPADPKAYIALLSALNDIEKQKGVCMNRLYYLSIPPQLYQPIIRHMGEAGLNGSCPHGEATTRLLVEKPFGYDLNSAEELISETAEVFNEDQVFRIDHFLAKEPVQNILAFRAQNPLFEAVWNHQHIASVEISASESIGIEGRGQFYDSLGALRDFIQNHLLQLLAITTMKQPTSLASDDLHAAKQQLLESVLPIPADQVVHHTIRGQYEGYRTEVDNPDSTTETYADITVYINQDHWLNVPFRLWTGKALAEKKYEIIIKFKPGSQAIGNSLRFRIQPNEGIELELLTKQPGFDDQLQKAVMDFSYHQNFEHQKQPHAYERVLLDASRGDHALFATSGEILASWKIIQPVLEEWAKNAMDLIIYQPKATGPLVAKMK